MKAIVTQIILSSLTSRVDGSLGFRGVTPELSSAEKVAMFELQGKNCRALFEPMDFSSDGKVEVKNTMGTKSPGERLRAVLFVMFKQLSAANKTNHKTFDEFYLHHMEVVIGSFKEQLEPET